MQMKEGSFTKLTFTIVCMKEALYEKVFKFDNFSRTYLSFLPYLLTNQHSITHSLIL